MMPEQIVALELAETPCQPPPLAAPEDLRHLRVVITDTISR